MEQAREVMKLIKADSFFGNPPILMSAWIAQTIRMLKEALPLCIIFSRRYSVSSFAEPLIEAT